MTAAFGRSTQGVARRHNEDAFAVADDVQLFVVADGMGGHNAGEVASRLAVESIVGFFRAPADPAGPSWPHGIDPALSFDANRLHTAIQAANHRVFSAAEETDACSGMGTTVVCALIAGRRLVVGHVGDSRLYMKSEAGLRLLTHDDSWAATILGNEPGGDKATLAKHPLRNVLTNVLGAREKTEIHMAEVALHGNEILLLCSDGLHGTLDEAAIDRLLDPSDDLARTVHALIAAAIDAGSRDDVTALVVACGVPAACEEHRPTVVDKEFR